MQDYEALERSDQQSLDLSWILEAARRRRWWILTGFAVSIVPALAYAILLVETPLYAATATVSVNQRGPAVMTFGESFMRFGAQRS